MARITKEKFKTYEGVFDGFTNKNLFKLISQGHFEGLSGPISIGKEANVFSAKTKNNGKVAVKIYRLETCDFNKMYEYIKYDSRFMHITKQRRKVIFAWAKREFTNLIKIRQLGIRVPKPITVLNNILVMEFIGNKEPAPKIKDSVPKNPHKIFKKIVEYMKKLNNNNYVHSDLSEFNILNYNNEPVFIDVSQATTLENQQTKRFRNRDIKNITRFFNKYTDKIKEEDIKKELKID